MKVKTQRRSIAVLSAPQLDSEPPAPPVVVDKPARPLQLPPEPIDEEPIDMHFRVDLDIFRGPLDLLLYLVRKHELDIANIAIAHITEQFVNHIEVLEQLDVNAVGDFIEMAGILIEIKSKMVLPSTDEQDEEATLEDPRDELVQQLLEYKKYKDAASVLEERSRSWQQSYTRQANDLPPRDLNPADQPIHEVELWDLVSAFGRIMRAHDRVQPREIIYDDTPIQVYMERLHGRICVDGQIAFSDMFQSGMHKSALIGVFLAVLELVRHHHVDADQNQSHGEIYLRAAEGFNSVFSAAGSDDYEGPVNTTQDDGPAVLTAKPR
ncbi:MAG: segregation/condensation protein A [Planctomycetales bacterium]|nr:segregation/condensation protein A [Planctomycetales bacterium]